MKCQRSSMRKADTPVRQPHREADKSVRLTERGGILLVTLVVCSLVGIMLACYLRMVSGQHTYTFRSQVWNGAIPICEAGIEEAMAHLNHTSTSNNNFGINGWVLSDGAYQRDRTTADGNYHVDIDTNFPPTVTVRGSAPVPLQSDQWITRQVRVRTKLSQRFPNAIAAKGSIVLQGNGGLVDSFNSTNLLESTLGQYDLLKRTDRANVVTLSGAAGSLNVGNSEVYGRAGTGPGGTVTVGANGNVGSSLWNLNPLNDGEIEPGYSSSDANTFIDDGLLPVPFGPTFAPSAGTNGGVAYKYVLRNNTDYQIASLTLSSDEKVLVQGKARIYVTGATSVSGQAYILVDTNSSVEWHSGGTVSLSGGGVINSPGLAKNFTLVGLNSCTTVTYSGGSKFVGTIYAPYAAVSVSGHAEGVGAIVGNTVTLSGGMKFHYDEALKGNPRHGRFIIGSWQEL